MASATSKLKSGHRLGATINTPLGPTHDVLV